METGGETQLILVHVHDPCIVNFRNPSLVFRRMLHSTQAPPISNAYWAAPLQLDSLRSADN